MMGKKFLPFDERKVRSAPMDVIAQVVVLFLLMFCGLLSCKARLISDAGIAGMNKMVVYFALPCLIVGKLQQDADPMLMRDLIAVFLTGGATMLLFGLVARFLLFRGEDAPRRAVFASMCMFSNAGYMGLPVLNAAFGPENLIYCVMYVAVFNLLGWSVGVMLFDRSALSIRKIATVPSLLAAVLGIVLFLLRIRLPGVVIDAMDSMAGITTPLAMFIIGTRLAQLRLSDLRDVKMLFACALRLLILPVLTYLLLTLFGFDGIVRATVTLCTAMPCAAQIVIQAENYHGDGALASRGVAVSTLLSIATIPIILLMV